MLSSDGRTRVANVSISLATSQSVEGKIYATDYSAPTPSNLAQAMSDFQNAVNYASQQTPNFSVAGAGSLDGLTLSPGM